MKEMVAEWPDLENEIIAAVEQGNELDEAHRPKEAVACYEKAWALLPEKRSNLRIQT